MNFFGKLFEPHLFYLTTINFPHTNLANFSVWLSKPAYIPTDAIPFCYLSGKFYSISHLFCKSRSLDYLFCVISLPVPEIIVRQPKKYVLNIQGVHLHQLFIQVTFFTLLSYQRVQLPIYYTSVLPSALLGLQVCSAGTFSMLVPTMLFYRFLPCIASCI